MAAAKKSAEKPDLEAAVRVYLELLDRPTGSSLNEQHVALQALRDALGG